MAKQSCTYLVIGTPSTTVTVSLSVNQHTPKSSSDPTIHVAAAYSPVNVIPDCKTPYQKGDAQGC